LALPLQKRLLAEQFLRGLVSQKFGDVSFRRPVSVLRLESEDERWRREREAQKKEKTKKKTFSHLFNACHRPDFVASC
jgi:hypothetical protein